MQSENYSDELKSSLNFYKKKDAKTNLNMIKGIGRVDQVKESKVIEKKTQTQVICLP